MDSEPAGNDDYFQKHMPGNICFGCGTDNPDGLQIKSYWQDDECICMWHPDDRYRGWPNLTCGGIIATLIDCHCMASAMALAVRNENRELSSEPQYRFATGTLNIRYLKPTPISGPLTLRARLKDSKDNRIYTLHCDLFAENEKTAEAEVVAFLVYRSDQSESTESLFNEDVEPRHKE